MRANGGKAPNAESEIAELLEPVHPLGVPRPAYEGRSLANIAPTLVRAILGELPPLSVPLSPPLSPGYDPFDGGRTEGTVVVFLIDGLGWGPFSDWTGRGQSAEAAMWEAAARPVTTVFPSTTTAALASLSSGTAPGRHGLVGYRQYLPGFGVVADMLKMSPLGVPTPDLLVGPNWKPSDVSGAPTVFRLGLPGVALSRDRFAGSGFTRVLYDGADYVPYATAADMAHELVRLLDGERPPRLIYTYWDELDTIQHLRGPTPDLTAFELDRLAHFVAYVRHQLSPSRRKSTSVMITGDHGQVPASLAARVSVETRPDVVRELAHPLAGDRRAGFFAARPGRVGALRSALTPILPEGAKVIDMNDAVEAGLFGPPPFHVELEQRLGDLLVLVPSPAALTYLVPGAAVPSRYLIGAHGGLDPAELIVPLVSSSLDDLGTERRESKSGPPKR